MKFGKLLNLIMIFICSVTVVGCQSSDNKDEGGQEGQSQEQEMQKNPQQGGQKQGQQPQGQKPQGQQQLRQQQQQAQDIDVSDKEIEQFGDIYDDIRSKREETRPKMEQAIKDEGLTMDRFRTIMQDQQKSRMQQKGQGGKSGGSDIDVSDEELEKFKSAQEEVRKIQQDMQQKIMKTIEESDMDQQRFQEISRAIQSNPELRKKLQEESGMGQQRPQQQQGR